MWGQIAGKYLPAAPIMVPVAFAILVFIVGYFAEETRARKVVDWLATLGMLCTLAIAIKILYKVVFGGFVLQFTYPIATLSMLGTGLKVDALSAFMAVIFSSIGFAASLYSVRYMEHDTGLTQYYVLLLLLVASLNGVAYAADLFTLFVFYEMMGISSYSLVAFRKHQWEPVEAAMKYLFMAAIGSTAVLLAMSMLYGLTGTLNFEGIANALKNAEAPTGYLYLVIALLIGGFGVKAAIVPMHSWLIDAHPAAPTSISAMLSGVVIKGGVYALVRTLFMFFPVTVYHWDWMLAVIGVVTMTVANIIALVQEDIKRLLAYSSIYNIGLIMLGVSIGHVSVLGLTGAMFHVLNHAIMKALAFLCAGCFLHVVGTRMLSDLKGVARRMPITGTCFGISLLALMGVPPLNGFWSKFWIILAVFLLPDPVYGGILGMLALINVLLATGYYAKVLRIVWMDPESEKVKEAKEAPPEMLIALIILTLAILVIGVYPQPFFEISEKAAESVIGVLG